MTDDFQGDNAALTLCIKALLDLDSKGSLVPHGIGDHARALLSAAASRLAQPAASAEPCKTCNDNGIAGNILNAEPCPAPTPPAAEQAQQDADKVDAQKNQELADVAMRFVDRAGDHCKEGPAEIICDQFNAAMADVVDKYGAMRGMPSSKYDTQGLIKNPDPAMAGDEFKEAVDDLGNQYSDEMGNITVDAWHEFARALLSTRRSA